MALDLMTVIVGSVSCIAFCLVILTLVVVLCRKDPLCCRFTSQSTQQYTEEPPHYQSLHSLIGVARIERDPSLHQRTSGPQLPGRLFIIGKPSDYHVDGPLPRLPSYESVRKNDRQRQIHSMIAQRFGLSDRPEESPPSYEEAFHHSQEASPVGIVSPHTQRDSSDLSENSRVQDRTSTASS